MVQFPAAAPPPGLSAQSIPRYRKQRGVNLGSWFMLEQWMTPHVFNNAADPKVSDHDIARGGNAKWTLEDHWDHFMKDEDWQWIVSKGFNSVRLPIGYHHLCGPIPDVIKNTDFANFHDTFKDAWWRIERAIETAGRYGLGIMIDLHGVAGAQNLDPHSGISTGRVGFWDSGDNLASASLALKFLAHKLHTIPHVIGLELMNEPKNDNRLQGWYESVLNEIRPLCGNDFPIYFHDSGQTWHYAPWAGKRTDFVILDFHLYRAFTEDDRKFTGDEHAQKLYSEYQKDLSTQSQSANGNFVMGEWSGALDPASLRWNKYEDENNRQRRVFVRAQLDLFDKYTAGWWFWSYKKEGHDGWFDSAWSARDAMQAEVLPAWIGIPGKFNGNPQQGVKEKELEQAHNGHKAYWAAHGGSPNPSVHAPGFSTGWDDALLFFGTSSNSCLNDLGFSHKWMKKRKEEYERNGNQLGAAAFEWEDGFKQGYAAAKRITVS